MNIVKQAPSKHNFYYNVVNNSLMVTGFGHTTIFRPHLKHSFLLYKKIYANFFITIACASYKIKYILCGIPSIKCNYIKLQSLTKIN